MTNSPFSFWTWIIYLRIQLHAGKVACIWHNEPVQIDAIKFERKQIHFLSDVFTAAVFVVVVADSRRTRAVTAKKCTKKRDARAELLFCQPITFDVLVAIVVVSS